MAYNDTFSMLSLLRSIVNRDCRYHNRVDEIAGSSLSLLYQLRAENNLPNGFQFSLDGMHDHVYAVEPVVSVRGIL